MMTSHFKGPTDICLTIMALIWLALFAITLIRGDKTRHFWVFMGYTAIFAVTMLLVGLPFV